MKQPIAVLDGGQGLAAILPILDAAGVQIDIRKTDLSHIDRLLRETRVFFSTDPQSNDVLRDALGLFAEARPCLSLSKPNCDLILVRETQIPVIEYWQTPQMSRTVILHSGVSLSKMTAFAFDTARRYHKESVTIFAEKNHFEPLFNEIASQYSDILNEKMSLDAGIAALASEPEIFDVVIAPTACPLISLLENIAGSSDFGAMTAIGERGMLFQVNAPTPGAALAAAVQMLAHTGQEKEAALIENAWRKTIENGLPASREFASAVIRHFGQKPEKIPVAAFRKIAEPRAPLLPAKKERRLIGVDVTIYHTEPLESLIPLISHITIGPLRLRSISNRGATLWPNAAASPVRTEEWLCRFTTDDGRIATQQDTIQILHALDHVNLEVINAEHLYDWEA